MHAPRNRSSRWQALRRPVAVSRRPSLGRARRGGTGFGLATRVVFLGTPVFAVPSLEALGRLEDHGVVEIAGVITQPDRPGSRGTMSEPAVKKAARERGIPVLQPERLAGSELATVLGVRPAALVWAAYGNKIPKTVLEAVAGRAVNVHASLLPRWRGAAPIAHAILAGDEETGVTLMEGTVELDAGPILAQARTRVREAETRGELEARLARLGGALLEHELPEYLKGTLPKRPQDPRAVTHAPKLDPKGGELDFTRPAAELVRIVRAYTPDPGAHLRFRGQRVGVLHASVAGGRGVAHGTFDVIEGVPHVAAGAGWLRLDEVRPAGKRQMSGAEWARGLRGLTKDARVPS